MENPREGIQDTQILWAKVHKQESYDRSNFDDYSDFLEIGKLWSTYFDVFGKPSGRATSRQNFVGLSSETKKLLSDQILNFGPDFFQIAELCPHVLELLESTGEELKVTKILWDKVQKQESYWVIIF